MPSTVRPQDAAADLQGRRLARPVVPEESADLPGPDLQRQIVHGLFLPIRLGQMFDFQHDPLLLWLEVVCFDTKIVSLVK